MDPWNIRQQPTRLEIRRNFFSSRVVEPWNRKSAEVKAARTSKSFKKSYEKHRGNRWYDK